MNEGQSYRLLNIHETKGSELQNDFKTESEVAEGFNLNDGYIQLPIILDQIYQLPPGLYVQDYELLLKDEFHCSLICLREFKNKYGLGIERKIIDLFNDFAGNHPIALVKFQDDLRLVRRKERVSVISLCEISNIDRLYELLNEKLGIVEVAPPTHVTLYTLQPNSGIGVNTDSELQATEIVDTNAVDINFLNKGI